MAKRIAARGGQLGPAIGKWTQVDVAYSVGPVGNVFTEPAPHKTTLALTREGLSRVGLNRSPDRTTPRGLERVTPEESLGFLRGAMGACWFQMAKLAQAVAAIDHGAALIAGNMLRQELRAARWHFANGLANDETLQRELAAIARPAEALLAKAPTVSDAALNAMRASNRSSELWDREAADWRAAISGSKAADLPTRQGQTAPVGKRDGHRLIEHEVPHTVQALRGLAPTGGPTTVSQPDDAPEREADEVVLRLPSIGPASAGGAGMSNATNARREHTPPATQTSLGQLDSGIGGIAADLNDLRVHRSTSTTAPRASASTLGHSAERTAARRNKLGFAGGQRLGVERGGAEWFALERQALAQKLAHVAQIRRQPEPGAETEWAPAARPSAKEIAAADDWLVGDAANGGGDATPTAALAAELEGLGPVLTRAIASGSGEPLPAGLRAELETAAGADLSPVRVHRDGTAAQAAAAVAAKAFAVGKDIYFAANAYDPASVEGQRLIAHEVAHTLQPEGQMGAGVTTHNDPVEHEANAFVEKFAKGEEDGQAIGFAATRTRLPRYPGVVPSALAGDKIRWINDADHSLGKVWQEDRGYIKNPTATRLSETVKNGKIAGEFSNGSFMYVVDESGELWVGKRLQKNMPHPTLIGGKDPKVQCAGMVEIRGGKIVKIDNHSGHFQGPRGSLRAAVKSFMKLPKQVFKKFSAESVHFDAGGKETRQIFNSLRMLKLKSFNPGKSINRLRMRWKNDPKFRGKVKGGLKSTGKAGLAILATLILDYFLSKWMASIEQSLIRQDLERLALQVEAELLKSLEEQAERLDMLNETNPDATVYFNIVYRLSWMTIYSSGGYNDIQANESYAGAALVSAAISETPAPEELKFENIEGCLGSTTKNEKLSMSEAVRVSDLYGDDEDLQADDASTLQQKPVP